ncbi:hypothetical protein [Nocardiopsis trehalosi]|uniref:hypothetical protein n=1 Tax=Nocardiopsis trehalosi TaxID=109329 RepID=UPI000A83DCD3|nr:hypothetical protein [Nocardiopsis trehalosi]
MSAATPFPDPRDKAAVRRWMRENRRPGGAAPGTPEEFAAVQRRRLLHGDEAGPAPRRRLDVALTGADTDTHTVRISVLGAFLSNLQESVAAVAQALTGRPTGSAPIPRHIRESTALSAAAVYPSSFGVELYGPDPDGIDPSDRMGTLPTILDDAVDTVFDVIDVSEGSEEADDRLAERLTTLGPRAMKHLGSLTGGLSDAGLGLSAAWHSGGHTRSSRWTAAGAMRVRTVCEESEFRPGGTVTVRGWLGSVSALRGTVEIRTDDGGIVRASSAEEVTRDLGRHFGKRVEAEVEVTDVRGAGGRRRRIYAVRSLRGA